MSPTGDEEYNGVHGWLHDNSWKRSYTSVLIVSIGVGASIGGYVGDALPVAQTLASIAYCVISHPNVSHASETPQGLP
ncbi:hypothetical protein L6452_21981 [Arctium lappa]|uniref:Uncharacterized protein n=1 Tax=Arctium lappa TaxID=4217 RepID=A0ACB9AYT2_ARCLA|nr:hypothetical protein L6452_21981 [Arctium lappa]